MITKTTKIVNQNGLHMRPSCMVVDIASGFDCDIKISAVGRESANAKSVMSISMLAAVVDDEVTVMADGEGEEEAVDAIIKLIEDGFSKAYAE